MFIFLFHFSHVLHDNVYHLIQYFRILPFNILVLFLELNIQSHNMPNRKRTFLILAILNVVSYTISSKIDYCVKFCEACVEDSISCTKPGFEEMPQHMSKTTKRFILINQEFLNTFLSRNNFSHICPPNVFLEHLTIRKSNINRIKSNAFSDLTHLTHFDLTYNKDLYIESRSFSGLNLKLLKLDHNDNLQFSIDAFVNFKVDALHMSYSSLEKVSFKLMEPILPYLKKLFLDNNKLLVLDQQFQNYFKYLETISLLQNPFQCTCSMKWLTAVYKYRIANGKLHSKVFTYDPDFSPICKGPKSMEGKYMHDLSLTMFNCDPPNLTQLKIDFQSATESELSCSAIQNFDQDEMTVDWFSDFINVIGKKMTSLLNSPADISKNKRVHVDTVLIKKNNSVDSYQCIAKNQNGNATAIVRISWPPVDKPLKRDKFFYQSTIESWEKQDEDNYLFQKRFTLLEMFGAVFGTFAITLIMFFFIYKIFFLNRHIDRKSMLPPNGYTTYEAAVYSDSQTYDIPGNSYPQSVLLPMPHLSSTPDHFIDFKTQKKFYQTT